MDEIKIIVSGATIQFSEQYHDFRTFVEETTDPIYKAIVNAFNELDETGKTNLLIKANVDNTEFDTVFEYTKDDAYILKDVINPFYENREDYEMCSKIMEVYSKITSN